MSAAGAFRALGIASKPAVLYKGDCRGCGECCSRFLPLTPADRARLKAFVRARGVEPVPGRADVDLLCPFLSKGRECLVYEARPEICRMYRCDRHAAGDFSDGERLAGASIIDMREEFG